MWPGTVGSTNEALLPTAMYVSLEANLLPVGLQVRPQHHLAPRLQAPHSATLRPPPLELADHPCVC